MTDPKFFRQYLDILNEGPPPGIGPNAPAKAPPAPDRPGYTKSTIPDGPQKGWTRYEKTGTIPKAEYEKRMTDFRAQHNTPDEMNKTAAQMNAPVVQVQGSMPGQDFTKSNLQVLQSLIDPQAQARYKEQEKQFGQAPLDKEQVKKDWLPMMTSWDDPQGVAKIALNAGMTPDEILKFIPKDFSLSSK